MKSEVKRIMAQVFGLPIDMIADDATADMIDGWSSLAHMNLVMALEDEFGVRFADNQILALVSCEAIADVLAKARPGKGAI